MPGCTAHSAAGRLVRIVVAACVLAAGPAFAARDVPHLAGRVNDTAAMIPPEVRDRLEARLAKFERDTGAQVVVLTVASLDGEPIERYAIRVARSWQLGRRGVDDGVLFVIARDDRRMRIEVGYGLEAQLTDLQCSHILDRVVAPAFRSGDFEGGVEAGVDAILGTLQGLDVIPSSPVVSDPARVALGVMFLLIVTPFSLIALFHRKQGWLLYAVLMPFWAGFSLTVIGPPGLLVLVAWAIGVPIVRRWVATAAGARFLDRHPGLAKIELQIPGSGGGTGSSGGGFSGGGDFGGGGSSASW